MSKKNPRPLPGNSRLLAINLAHAMSNRRHLKAQEWALDDEAVAYAVQDGLVDMFGWYEDEYTPQYWKSGGPSREARLTHAPLPPELVRQLAHAPDGVIDFSELGLTAPVAEAEIALRIGRPVARWEADTITPAAAAALIHSFTVSIEIVSSRWEEGSDAPALLRLADLQSNGALALGEWLPWQPGRDWSTQACSLRVNDEAPQHATGTHPLGDPAWGLAAWLKHVTRRGETVPAGSVVTTGAWIVRKDLKAGDRITVGFDDIGAVTTQL
ncbi:fumarylacetoacetate hydrolase family protein [Paucibacter sp. R3-3]|uniref:Fumarylacetoacetate hydrolase family protein n=1 Tax=Roseateles agri TaxID=3098619 RepID=A0ABU5DFD8_9BURK|nr:fumarylacetoacetate hydrolase family protein [Paucibacter sp. R3-3]MDY0745003.1 fumarylacetoacetate hydrolase family protein [Paucibacter sp. R3-3]